MEAPTLQTIERGLDSSLKKHNAFLVKQHMRGCCARLTEICCCITGKQEYYISTPNTPNENVLYAYEHSNVCCRLFCCTQRPFDMWIHGECAVRPVPPRPPSTNLSPHAHHQTALTTRLRRLFTSTARTGATPRPSPSAATRSCTCTGRRARSSSAPSPFRDTAARRRCRCATRRASSCTTCSGRVPRAAAAATAAGAACAWRRARRPSCCTRGTERSSTRWT